MSMMFFYFLKIIFDISTSKRSKKYKPQSILAKTKFKRSYKHNHKLPKLAEMNCNLLGIP